MNVSYLSHYRAIAKLAGWSGWSKVSYISDRIHFDVNERAARIAPVAKGDRSHSSNGDSGLVWWYFRNTSPRLVRAWLVLNNYVRADVMGAHDCTGEYFAHSPFVRVVGSRVLVTQLWGHDV